MSAPLSIAVLGFWHVHAAEYAQEIQSHPDTELAAVWDPDEVRRREAADSLGVPFVADLDDLLSRDDLHGVTVTTATADHVDVIGRAVRAGKHVFTEKLLAATVAEAEELIAAADASGVALVVSLPRLQESRVLAAKRLVDDGALGELTYTRFRMAHDGWLDGWLPERFADPTQAVGGAIADLGCHPAYLTQHFLGQQPETVSAAYTRSTGRAVEDNAAVTLSFAGGAIGVFEASFVTTPGASTLELRGTEGSLLSGFGSEALLAKGSNFAADDWHEVALPPAGPAPFEQWVHHIQNGTRADENLLAALELTRVVAAAARAAEFATTIRY